MEPQWICTDLDIPQFGRQLSDDEFEFKEFRWDSPKPFKSLIDLLNDKIYWVQMTIDLRKYTGEQILYYIQPYGYESIEQMKAWNNDDIDWLVAECIFEQESGLY